MARSVVETRWRRAVPCSASTHLGSPSSPPPAAGPPPIDTADHLGCLSLAPRGPRGVTWRWHCVCRPGRGRARHLQAGTPSLIERVHGRPGARWQETVLPVAQPTASALAADGSAIAGRIQRLVVTHCSASSSVNCRSDRTPHRRMAINRYPTWGGRFNRSIPSIPPSELRGIA